MALSCLFSDSKVADNVGSMMLIFPLVIFVNFLAIDGPKRHWLYAFNWIPVIPGSSLLVILSTTDKAAF